MKSAVSIKNLQFRWGVTSPLVLDMPEITIATGSRVFIEGPSGSGKSTLLNIIGGVLEPLEGSVKIFDHSFEELKSSERDRIRGDEMGFVFQTFNLIPYLSVLENIILPLRFSKLKTEKLQELGVTPEAEAHRLVKSLRMDPDKLLSRKVSQLSIGQQQRVACARALIGSPGLIIADEPTSSLDYDARASFLNVLFEECQRTKATLVFVSHDSSLGLLFEKVLDLKVLNKAYHPVGV